MTSKQADFVRRAAKEARPAGFSRRAAVAILAVIVSLSLPGEGRGVPLAGEAEASLSARERVAEVQRELTALGYHPGPHDGMMSTRTRVALRAYQADHGLAIDGRATPELLAQLRRGGAAPASPSAAPASGDPAVAMRRAALRVAPSAAAPLTGRALAAGESVLVSALAGRWARVRRAGGSEAWVAASDLRLGASGAEGTGAGEAATDWLRQLSGLLSPREQAPAAPRGVTIGIRGLDQNDISTARPDPGAVDRMAQYRADRSAAIAHARSQALDARELSYVTGAPGAGRGTGHDAAPTSGSDR